jgi:hypothetical protein
MRLQIVFQNALHGPRYSWHGSHFTVSGLYFRMFCSLMDVLSVPHLQWRSHVLNLERHWKTCVLPVICCPESSFNISEVSVVFSQFKAKFGADTLFFQVCHFLHTSKLRVEKHTPVLNRLLLINHVCCIHIWSGKWLSRLLYLYLAVEVHACSSGVISQSVQMLFYCTMYTGQILEFHIHIFITNI